MLMELFNNLKQQNQMETNGITYKKLMRANKEKSQNTYQEKL